MSCSKLNQTFEDFQTESDWLDALELLRASIPSANIFDIYRKTKFEPLAKRDYVAHIVRFETGPFQARSDAAVTMQINPRILDYPHIERVEFFLSFALEVWKYKENKTWEELRNWSRRLGCDYSNAIHPRQRWHWIVALPNSPKLPIWAIPDDRPKCGSCAKAMPTGSDCHPSRPGVHENCGYELDAIHAALKAEGWI